MSYNGIGLSSVRGTATSGHVQANQGHVRASRLRRQRENNRRTSDYKRFNPVSASAREKGNKELQHHDQKRKLENYLLILREELEEGGKLSEAEIDARVSKERERQLAQRKELDEAESARQAQREAELAERLEGGVAQDRGISVEPSPRGQHLDHRRPPAHWQQAQQQSGNTWNQRRGAREKNNHVNAARKEHENERLRDAFGIRKDQHVEGQAFDQELQKEKKRERQARLEEEQKAIEKAEVKRLFELAKLEKKDRKKASVKAKDNRRRRSPSTSSSSGSSSSQSYTSASESSSSSAESRRKRRRRRARSCSSSSSSDDSRPPSKDQKLKKSTKDVKDHAKSKWPSPPAKRRHDIDHEKPEKFEGSGEKDEETKEMRQRRDLDHSYLSSHDSRSSRSTTSSSRSRSRSPRRNRNRITDMSKHKKIVSKARFEKSNESILPIDPIRVDDLKATKETMKIMSKEEAGSEHKRSQRRRRSRRYSSSSSSDDSRPPSMDRKREMRVDGARRHKSPSPPSKRRRNEKAEKFSDTAEMKEIKRIPQRRDHARSRSSSYDSRSSRSSGIFSHSRRQSHLDNTSTKDEKAIKSRVEKLNESPHPSAFVRVDKPRGTKEILKSVTGKEREKKVSRSRSSSYSSSRSSSRSRSRSINKNPEPSADIQSKPESRRERSRSVDSFGRVRPAKLNRGHHESSTGSSSSSSGSSRRRS